MLRGQPVPEDTAAILATLAQPAPEQLQAAGAHAAEQYALNSGVASPYATTTPAPRASKSVVKKIMVHDSGYRRRHAALPAHLQGVARFGTDVPREHFRVFQEAKSELRRMLASDGATQYYMPAEVEAQGEAAVARFVHVFVHHFLKVRSCKVARVIMQHARSARIRHNVHRMLQKLLDSTLRQRRQS